MKVLTKRIGKLVNCESGGVLILVAFVMVVILGMAVIAIDVGSLYQARRQAVNAADAAALAGAQEKIIGGSAADVDDAVKTYAVTYNGADDYEILDQTADTIKVRVEKNAPLWFYPAFAGLLGHSGESVSLVSAEATALIYPPEGLNNLVPIAINMLTVDLAKQTNESVNLTSSPTWDEDMGPGNFGFVAFSDDDFDLNDTGGKILGERIKKGFPGYVSIGDQVNPETGQKVGQVKKAVEWRYENDSEIVIPIIEHDAYVPGQSGTFEVIGFAAFKIDNYVFQANEHRVTGTFIELIAVGKQGGSTETSHGVYAITLIE